MSRIVVLAVSFLISIQVLGQVSSSTEKEAKIKGITLVAPPKPFTSDPIPNIKSVNASWIAVVPFGFTRKGENTVRHNSPWQWWGETKDGIMESVKLAHKQGVKVMLKPQIYIPGSWVGDMDFDSDEDWKVWEESYMDYIMYFVDIAIQENIDMLCIGTEFKIAIKKREKFWRKLIAEIRTVYDGKLIYSSNWDSYKEVPFWDALDYIGISAYFPLTKDKTPEKNQLLKKWRPIVKTLKKYSAKQGKKIVFTEYGYLSVDGCAHKTWELEKKVGQLSINEQAQANAIESILSSFWQQDFWAGGFLWKWFPNGMGHEGYPEKDYTPQNKISEQSLAKWYKKK